MALQEIERKFLVKNKHFKKASHGHYKIMQGYLNADPRRSVRIRIKEEKGFITVKGKSSKEGTTRFEWEKEIPLKEAEAMLDLCEPALIEKTRYEVEIGEHTFEIDEFFGKNQGLTMAEIELESEDQIFQKPDWLGEEVTGDKNYYNAYLSKHPFSTW